ncbi:hypothetical protein MLD38_030089 [Melastoma candidum]|uniref:Uncharacterized protein n=1 Tax=Melastoma candidum TaxID=119954 RepID=A0ACB9MMH9_9MYRT|nr:hypothetical protein MLD38_030089 [Melastoma candidum]
MTNTVELVFIPCPGMGHLPPMLELADRLAIREPRLSISVLLVRFPDDTKVEHYARSVAPVLSPRVKISFLPLKDGVVGHNSTDFVFKLIESHRPDVMDAVVGLRCVSAFVVDMICTSMMDLATSIGVPSYVFCPAGATFLGFMYYLLESSDRHGKDFTEYADSDDMVDFPGLLKPLPATVLPLVMVKKETKDLCLGFIRKMREAKGVLVNTFAELEPTALKYLSELEVPPVYPVGPMVRSNRPVEATNSCAEIFDWLDNQPELSVVFLCFGSRGSFSKDQVKEIAVALEKAGHHFLWSLKTPPEKDNIRISDDYQSFDGILPEGFLERTSGIGRVIGWAPQAEILVHPSVGGFVSHCGWNSILESVWSGVPIGTWPQYSEQQFNAFLMVEELGLGVDIKMDYKVDLETGLGLTLVGADEIEKAVRDIMEEGSERRKKVKKMGQIGRKALKEEGGDSSSYHSLGRFIHDVLTNNPRRSSLC